jgi:hypothetical protein
MIAAVQHAVLVATGLLSLQLAVITTAQETAASSAQVSGSSASPLRKVVTKSSQSPDPAGYGTSRSGEVTQPDKADDMGDPALGGELHPLYRLSKSDVIDVLIHNPELRS